MKVFADTAFWIGLLHEDDSLHAVAVDAAGRHARDHIVTSELVLVEVLNYFSRHGPRIRAMAADLSVSLRVNPNCTVVAITESLLDRGRFLYRSARDKRWSLTDCCSFEIMRDEGVTHALASDRDFSQAGFVLLLR